MTTQKKTRPTTTARRPAAAKTTRAASGRSASAAARPRRRASTPDHATIAERAYFIGLEGGADPVTNWLQAERELARAA